MSISSNNHQADVRMRWERDGKGGKKKKMVRVWLGERAVCDSVVCVCVKELCVTKLCVKNCLRQSCV